METENAPKFSRFQLFKTKILCLKLNLETEISKVYTLQDPNLLELSSTFKIHSVR